MRRPGMVGRSRSFVRKAVQPTANAATTWRESGVLTPVAALSCAAARRWSREISGSSRPSDTGAVDVVCDGGGEIQRLPNREASAHRRESDANIAFRRVVTAASQEERKRGQQCQNKEEASPQGALSKNSHHGKSSLVASRKRQGWAGISVA